MAGKTRVMQEERVIQLVNRLSAAGKISPEGAALVLPITNGRRRYSINKWKVIRKRLDWKLECLTWAIVEKIDGIEHKLAKRKFRR